MQDYFTVGLFKEDLTELVAVVGQRFKTPENAERFARLLDGKKSSGFGQLGVQAEVIFVSKDKTYFIGEYKFDYTPRDIEALDYVFDEEEDASFYL